MNSVSAPLSDILRAKAKEQEDDEPKKKTREEWKKAKELEEARKAGTAPAAVDEEGKDINPHIPQYISSAPWYFGSQVPTLKHQRPQPEKQKEYNHLNDYYVRGIDGDKSNKFRKGACENCGAMGHQKKDCFERPRKVGAKYTSRNIAPDDVMLPDLALDYDGKRDRWNGYDPSTYQAVVEEHEKVTEYKRQLKAEKLKGGEDISHEDVGDNDDDDEDEDKYAESFDMPGTKVDSKQRITVRNLRIREDTAKYLRNLDLNSAYYDPKTRSMRDNPYKETGIKATDMDYAGENFVRFTGDTVSQAKAQLFAWEAFEKGIDVSLQAEPTKLELLQKEYTAKKEEYKEKVSDDLLEKYGGKEHFDVPPREMLLGQTENYVEFSRHGKIIKGGEKEVIRSKYEEDVYCNNHTSVWGSYWKDGEWGYKCCHSLLKNSYCTGEAGKQSTSGSVSIVTPFIERDAEKGVLEESQGKEQSKNKKKKIKKKRKEYRSSSESSDNESESSEDKEEKRKRKLRNALIKAKLQEDLGEKMQALDDRQRKYNSMYEEKPLTEEDLEAYQIRRQRPEDPMASFLSSRLTEL